MLFLNCVYNFNFLKIGMFCNVVLVALAFIVSYSLSVLDMRCAFSRIKYRGDVDHTL